LLLTSYPFFSDTLALGSSEPWQTALQKLTGGTEMDALPLLEFFQPLQTWLQAENKKNGVVAGWKSGKNTELLPDAL
jgi:hypothetical protein